jgi:hypothetical protein
MKKVIAEEVISYICNCPHCDEIIFSEYQDDWDISENRHYALEIRCSECEESFNVDLP